MLVLTRKIGEQIFVGDKIKVSIVKIQGKRVQIAIEAPASVAIDRSEVRERVAAALASAASCAPVSENP
jgi:carbon storage regulator